MDSSTQLFTTIQNNTDYKFPRQELEHLIAHPEESIPMLLHLLKDINENIDVYYEDEDFIGHLYAFFLLAQFREKRAYSLITQFFFLHGDRAEEMCGDFVTEDLARVLASVFDGDLTPIMQLIENSKVNEWVRGASVKSVIILVIHNIVSYDEGLLYFRELFNHKLEREHAEVWGNLVVESIDLYPEALQDEIRQAFRNNYVNEFVVGQSYLGEALAKTKEAHLATLHNNHHYTLVADTIAEMEWWAAFQDPMAKQNVKSKSNSHLLHSSSPNAQSKPKIGRNDPCHCGSGKKYKKCCWPN